MLSTLGAALRTGGAQRELGGQAGLVPTGPPVLLGAALSCFIPCGLPVATTEQPVTACPADVAPRRTHRGRDARGQPHGHSAPFARHSRPVALSGAHRGGLLAAPRALSPPGSPPLDVTLRPPVPDPALLWVPTHRGGGGGGDARPRGRLIQCYPAALLLLFIYCGSVLRLARGMGQRPPPPSDPIASPAFPEHPSAPPPLHTQTP